jgi:cyclopropane-fatty-acyl-phospholipid synthase
MTYSCAIFDDLDGDIENGTVDHAPGPAGQCLERIGNYSKTSVPLMPDSTSDDPLYKAQLRKIRHIIFKADIQAGHRVLEIGSGWGSLAIEAVRLTGCTVDTITLSLQQQELAQERIRAAGFEDRITVHLMDYRNMPYEWEGAFDRLVSIEMIEAVGKEFLKKYWSVVDWALKTKGAVGVVQVITIPEPSKLATFRLRG